MILFLYFFFKQKTAYDMRISDWSSDVCSSDLVEVAFDREAERKADGLEFGQREAAEFGAAEAEIGEAEENTVRIDLGREPGRRADGAEQADDRFGVRLAFAARKRVDPGGQIGAKLRLERGGQEFHGTFSWVDRRRASLAAGGPPPRGGPSLPRRFLALPVRSEEHTSE